MATILVVDDNDMNRSVLTTLLGYRGHRMLEASNGLEAIDRTIAERPDLIITDILMPNMDGYELVQKLQALDDEQQAQIIFYSATYLEGEARALARACGVCHVICKPAEPENILKIVDEALAKGRPTEVPAGPKGALHGEAIRILNDKLYRKVMEIEELNDALEKRVAGRTLDLEEANRALRNEILAREKAQADSLRNREEQLKMKGEFLSHVSHELRSPLGVVHQFTTILLDGLGGALNQDQREYLEIMLRNINQLKYMIDDLLEASRAEAGKLVVRRSSISMPDVVAHALESMTQASKEKGIGLKTDSRSELPAVYADPARVSQVLINLLDNAVKFSPPDSTITVRTEIFADDPSFVLVSVIDCGCGIEPADAERVFDRLYQVKDSRQASRQGLGLGLYICKEILGLHGGAIWIDRNCRAGATFHFTLPAFTTKNMIAPIVIQNDRLVSSLALLTVEVSPATPWRNERERERAVHKVHQILERCMLADLDVLYPVQNQAESDVFTIVARTDQRGGGVMVSRVRNQLSRCSELSEAGIVCAVDCEFLEFENLGLDGPPEDRIARIASCIDDRIKSKDHQRSATR